MIPLDRLIVVAAPSCCGKTTFINNIRKNKLQSITTALQMDDALSWAYEDAFYINAKFLRNVEHSPARNMVMHWTIPHPTVKLAFRNLLILNEYDKKERLKILQTARDVTILTLYTSQHDMVRNVQFRRERIRQRRLEGTESLYKFARKRWNMWRLVNLYSNMRNLIPLYERWFQFCQTLNARASYLVNVQGNPTLDSTTKWSEIREGWMIND